MLHKVTRNIKHIVSALVVAGFLFIAYGSEDDLMDLTQQVIREVEREVERQRELERLRQQQKQKEAVFVLLLVLAIVAVVIWTGNKTGKPDDTVNIPPLGDASQNMFCSNCGYPQKTGDRFCEGCGATIDDHATPPENQKS